MSLLKPRNIIFVLLAILIGLAGCMDKTDPDFGGSGTLEATQVMISAQTSGAILQLTREEGDRVEKNDLLALIDVEKQILQKAQTAAGLKEIDAGRAAAAAEIAKAEENLKHAQTQYQRIAELYSRGSATKQQLDDITSQRNMAKSQLAAARAQLPMHDARQAQIEASLALLERQIADGTVTSPLSGTVVEKYVESGELAMPGGLLYKIADLSNFWLKIYVAGADLDRFNLGDTVRVAVDAHDKAFSGRVSWVSPEAEFTPKNVQTRQARAELVYAVKVVLENPEKTLKIGMPAEVYLN